MNTKFTIPAALVMLLSSCANATMTETDMKEGRYEADDECRYIAQVEADVCRTSFLKLASDPGKFDGKYVELTGFALAEEGFSYLFLSKDAYLYGAGRGGIDLLVSDEMLSKFNEVARDTQKPVTVIGRFDVLRGRLPGSIGVISGERMDVYSARLPWEAPLAPKD